RRPVDIERSVKERQLLAAAHEDAAQRFAEVILQGDVDVVEGLGGVLQAARTGVETGVVKEAGKASQPRQQRGSGLRLHGRGRRARGSGSGPARGPPDT